MNELTTYRLPFTVTKQMLKLEIVTPEKKVFDDSVDSVTVPTASGEAGILPNHAPLVSALKPGILSYSNKVSILTDSAQAAGEIDAAAARADREAAEKALAAHATAALEDTEADREKLEAANVRLQLAGK